MRLIYEIFKPTITNSNSTKINCHDLIIWGHQKTNKDLPLAPKIFSSPKINLLGRQEVVHEITHPIPFSNFLLGQR